MNDIPLPISLKCLYPERIYNHHIGQYLTVPCGHCDACRLNKGSRLAFQCDLEKLSHKYCVFITLTYSDRFIPKAKFEFTLDNPIDNTLVDCTTGEVLGEFVITDENKEIFLNKVALNGYVPYLRKSDAQAFLKRFRYYASKYTKSKVRYFLCGEYGPVHYRPHFHLLLYFSDDALLQVCESCVRKAWTFGRIDCQLSKGKTSSYVASYVNSRCNLPRFLEVPATRPFSLHSIRMGQGILQGQRETLYDTPPREFVQRSLTVNGEIREFSLWRSCYAYYYPKCQGFSVGSSSKIYDSYTIYRECKECFDAAESCADLSVDVAMFCREFNSIKDYVYEMPTVNKDKYVKIYDSFTDSDQNAPLDSDTWSKYVNRCYTKLLVSRHFLTFVCDTNSNKWPTLFEIKRKVKLITEFYKTLDYLQLTKFFELQKLYYEDDLVGDEAPLMEKNGDWFCPFFYDNCPIDGYAHQELYFRYKYKTYEMVKNRLKHKKLNDMNSIFIDI